MAGMKRVKNPKGKMPSMDKWKSMAGTKGGKPKPMKSVKTSAGSASSKGGGTSLNRKSSGGVGKSLKKGEMDKKRKKRAHS